MISINIGDKDYTVKEAKTEEEKNKGLQGITELDQNSGMIFYFDNPQTVSMWMKDTLIPLDIIFINSNDEVSKVHQGIPKDETLISQEDTKYVLEVNVNSGIQVGDEFNIDEDDEPPVMKVLSQDGSSQMDLWGGERIVSRRETKIIIKKAKKADQSNKDSDYMSLGRYIFKVFKGQDTRPSEYVKSPS